MTTIIALLSRDFIVLGSDSLATYSHMIVPAQALMVRLEPRGRPVDGDGDVIWKHSDIQNIIRSLAETRPLAHMTQVDKIFHIGTVDQSFGVMMTGTADLDDKSVESIIQEFGRTQLKPLLDRDDAVWSLQSVGTELYEYMQSYYQVDIQSGSLDLMLCGFEPTESGGSRPAVVEIDVAYESDEWKHHLSYMNPTVSTEEPGVIYAGTTGEIERLVRGIDWDSQIELEQAIKRRLRNVEEEANQYVQRTRPKQGKGSRARFRPTDSYLDFNDLDELGVDLPNLDIDYSGISVQKAIDFVDFLINAQIKADEFSRRLPTVGGDVQLALIQREGFKWISKREWRLGEHVINRDE